MGLFALQSPDAGAASTIYLPNYSGKSVTTPVAWGASNNVIFMGVGGTTPSTYSNASDGAAELGIGLGDPRKNLGVQISVVSIDLSQWNKYSSNYHIFRDLGNANAIGVGVENVFLTTGVNGGDAGKSYYVVYSQSVQAESFVDKTNDGSANHYSKLHYSVGAGTGRFGDKSPMDIAKGKSAHGTYIFGNIAYDVANGLNVITDWNGLNLNAGLSKTFRFANIPIAATIGAADLTSNSGDRVRFVIAVGTGFKL